MKFAYLPSITAFFLCLCWNSPWALGVEEFMSGAVPIREPDNLHPIMFSNVIPLIYQFHLPVWDSGSMKIQFWKEHNNCTVSDSYESGYPCPIMYHMNTLLENFSANASNWRNLFVEKQDTNDESLEFLHDPSILWNKEICTSLRIEPHFKSTQASSEQLQKYIEVFSQCAEINGTSFNKIMVNTSNDLISLENRYHDTFASFTADYWDKLTQVGREASSIVAWTALQAALMVHQHAETQKWTHAVEYCRNQQIPWTLIDAENLRGMLDSLKSNYLEMESQALAINLDEVSTYFRLPLTDCVFGDDNTFIVRILVPVIPGEARNQNYFFRYQPVPFITQGKVCSLWEGRESISFNLGLNGVMPCSCQPSDKLCKGWASDSYESCTVFHRKQETCLHALSSDIEEDILEYCPLTCRDTREAEVNQLDIITESNNKYIIKVIPGQVRETSNLTFMQCSNGLTAMEINFESTGAYEMTIPTGCSLVQVQPGNNNSFSIVTEIDGVSIKHLMPYHWRNGISTESSFHVIEESFIDNIEKVEGVDPKISLLASKLQKIEEGCKRTESDTIIWVCLALLLLVNLGLCVTVFRLNKWKCEVKLNAKSDKMVYNLTSNDEIDDFPINEQLRNPLYPLSRNSNHDL